MKYLQGNLIEMFKDGQFDVIAHQCNCFAGGAGFFYYLQKDFPEIANVYKKSENHPNNLYGEYSEVKTYFGTIVNMYSQYTPGSCSSVGLDTFQVRCAILETILTRMNIDFCGLRIGFPLIASGIAADKGLKGDMTDLEYFKFYIEPIIQSTLKDVDVTIVYL